MNWTRWNVPPNTSATVLIGQRLREAGHALDQEVPAREQADEDALEHLVLAGDHALDLEDRALDHVAVGGALECSQSLPFHAHSLRPDWLVAFRLPAGPKSRVKAS